MSRDGTLPASSSFITSPVLLRAVILFVGLALLKVGLMWDQRVHLTQVHWRVSGFEAGVVDHIAFYLFVGLLIAGVFLLGRHCETKAIGVARAANVSLLTLALLFVFLTFHEGNRNYLYPVQTGVLVWGDLWAYLSLKLFFEPPFLAGWITLYAAVYYVLRRLGRENLMLRTTALFFGGYCLIFFRDFPITQARSTDLLIVVTIGLACLPGAWRSEKPLTLAWLPLAIGWVVLTAIVLTAGGAVQDSGFRYFLVPASCIVAAFLIVDLLARKAGFYRPWSHLAPFLLSVFLLLGVNHYPWAGNHHAVVGVALASSRYFIGELFVVLAWLLTASLWKHYRPNGSLRGFDVVALLVLFTALVDFRLAQVMGTRLDWDLLSFGHDPVMMWRLVQPYLPSLVAMMTAVIALYFLCLILIKRVGSEARPVFGRLAADAGVRAVALGAVVLAVIGMVRIKPDKVMGQSALRVAASSPLVRSVADPRMTEEEFYSLSRALDVRFLTADDVEHAAVDPVARPNVVFILLESTYNQHLSLFGAAQETQPLLTRYRDRMELFPNFFCNYMSSIHARFACFTGLHPVQDYHRFTVGRVPVKSIFEIFSEQDYECSMFYSSFLDYTCFRDLLRGRGLDEIYDADTMPGATRTESVAWGIQESATLEAMKMKIGDYSEGGNPFFLTYVPACPHNPFDSIPPEFARHKMSTAGDHTPDYLNSLLYMDWVVAELIGSLEQHGLLENTIVVMTGDHGEMLGADGGRMGHGWNITPRLANVPLIVMNPANPGFAVNETFGSQIDLLPTICGLAGIQVPGDQLYQGGSLYDSRKNTAPIFINSYGQFAVVQDKTFTVGGREQFQGADESLNAWKIVNTGSTTEYTSCPVGRATLPPADVFDRFQTALLRDYGRWQSPPSEK